MNKVLRKDVKKKSDINSYSEEFIQEIIRKYNDAPKEKLKWKTPDEVMLQWKLFKDEKDRWRGFMQWRVELQLFLIF